MPKTIKSIFEDSSQTYTLTGKTDQPAKTLLIPRAKIDGNILVTVHARYLQTTQNAKWGVIFADSTSAENSYFSAAIQPDGTVSLTTIHQHLTTLVEMQLHDVLQLEYMGSEIVIRTAAFGNALQEIFRIAIDLPANLCVGLFVSCATAEFFNLRIDVPAALGVDGYAQPSPSRLELLELATGRRAVIYSSLSHFEAPNWSRNGNYLLFNQDGKIYQIDLHTKIPILLDTGEGQTNNNDHGISFDGTKLALSSHTEQAEREAGSQIYVMDLPDGKPQQVTDQAPSYWHGWSPDGNILVYTARRNQRWDIWAIPSQGGQEFQLTTIGDLNDGPEFHPNGEHIYFNSTRTGNMKIWRMRPDGSEQTQVSFGAGQDWFAHISPDGSRMVYLRYPESVPAALHPHNQHVAICEQNIQTGAMQLVAYVYGGQGTLNVPAWSPDGRYLAFVSYTYGDPSF